MEQKIQLPVASKLRSGQVDDNQTSLVESVYLLPRRCEVWVEVLIHM